MTWDVGFRMPLHRLTLRVPVSLCKMTLPVSKPKIGFGDAFIETFDSLI